MTRPTADALFEAIGATWPPLRSWQAGAWTYRDGAGGGKRVSAATAATQGAADTPPDDLPPLIMVRQDEAALDRALAAAGYDILDRTRIMLVETATLAATPPARLTTFAIWPPLAIMDEIWDEGGIGPERRAVMARAKGPKTAIFGRADNQPAGAAFVAAHGSVAMVHAVEVRPALRRQKLAVNMMRAAAAWAQDRQIPWLSVLVTEGNAPARALYRSLGMEDVGYYHYRMKAPQRAERAGRVSNGA